MKTLLALLEALLPGFFTGNAKPLYKMIVALAILAAIIAWILTAHAGCMTTTDVDGKVYSFRVDILTPIGATTGPQAGTLAAPAPPRRPSVLSAATTQPQR